MTCCADGSFAGFEFMAFGRPLHVSLVGGSLASIALHALEEAVSGVGELRELVQPACLDCPFAEDLHLPSFAWGLLLGLAAGPVIDFLFSLRWVWGCFVLARLLLATAPAQLFRILS